jgi:peptide/nickel transport system permease protein
MAQPQSSADVKSHFVDGVGLHQTVQATEAPDRWLRRLLGQPAAAISFGWIALLSVLALVASWIAPFDPAKPDINSIVASPSAAHWLGTDSAGRDVLSRLLVGTRNSLLGVLLCVVIAFLIGVTGGLLAGYFGGKIGAGFSWVSNLIMAMPGIVLLVAVRAALGGSVWVAMSVFGVIIAPAFFRLVSVTVRAVRNELYIDAAQVSGLSDRRIISRHVLGVIRAPIIIQTAIVASIALAIQAGLAILGFGDPNISNLGTMLSDGQSKLFLQPLLLLWPSLVLASVTISLVTVANALRDLSEGPRVSASKVVPIPSTTDLGNDLAALDPPIVHPSDTSSSALLLQVRDLVVGYPDPSHESGWVQVVRGVSLDVYKGEVVGLVGESGSGKTQSAFAILGLLPVGGRILGGSIQFAETELVGLRDKQLDGIRGRRIAYVPQEPMSNLDPSYSVGSQLVEPLRKCLGLSKSEAKSRALELLARVGIPNPTRTYRSYPHELSGGMAQRVLIAGAVSCGPDLIIADEPTTALDVTVQAEILDLLRELQRELNTSLVLVTHNFGVVADLCDSVAVMQAGRIVEQGPVRSIFNDAKHPYTQSLLEAILEEARPRGPYVERSSVHTVGGRS